MGCPPSKQKGESNEDNCTQLVVLTRQLSVEFRMEEGKLEGEVKSLTQKIKDLASKPPSEREKHKQQNILEEIVYKSDLRLIFKLLFFQCQTILERNTYLKHIEAPALTAVQAQQKKVVMLPIQTIVFSIDIIYSGKINKTSLDLEKFYNLIKSRFPSITPIQETKHEVINYYKKQSRPNKEMIRDFVLTFCQEENVALSVFNSSGHDFHY